MDIHVCPWCHRSLPENNHTVTKVSGMWIIGCPQYDANMQPVFLNKDLYKIHATGKIILQSK